MFGPMNGIRQLSMRKVMAMGARSSWGAQMAPATSTAKTMRMMTIHASDIRMVATVFFQTMATSGRPVGASRNGARARLNIT